MAKHKHSRRLIEIKEEIKALKDEIDKFAQEGLNMDALNAALTELSTEVDNAVTKGAGTATPAQLQAATDIVTGLTAKLKTIFPA